MNNEPFSFLDLPHEIRFMIYKEYFKPKTWVRELEMEYSDDEQCFNPHDGVFVREEPVETSLALVRNTLPSALLRTSHAVFSEAKFYHDIAFKKHITDQVATIKIHNPRRYAIWDLARIIETKMDAIRALERFSPYPSHRPTVNHARRYLTWESPDPNRDVILTWSLQSAFQQLNDDDNDVVILQLSWDDGTSDLTKHRTESFMIQGCDPAGALIEYV